VELGALADLPDDHRHAQRGVPGLDAERVGDAFRREEVGGAEELLRRGGRATVGKEVRINFALRSAHDVSDFDVRSAPRSRAARKSSGRTAQISRSKGSPPRSPPPGTVRSWRHPSPVTVRFAASLNAGISP